MAKKKKKAAKKKKAVAKRSKAKAKPKKKLKTKVKAKPKTKRKKNVARSGMSGTLTKKKPDTKPVEESGGWPDAAHEDVVPEDGGV